MEFILIYFSPFFVSLGLVILFTLVETIRERYEHRRTHPPPRPIPTEPGVYIAQITAVGDHARQRMDTLFKEFVNDMHRTKGNE